MLLVFLVLMAGAVAGTHTQQQNWEQLFQFPAARQFSIALQQNMESLISAGPVTLFVPENPEDQSLSAGSIEALAVKGWYPAHKLAWAHMETLSSTSSPILWGQPVVDYNQLSTVKVAGDYYIVHGENDKRVHLKLNTNVIVTDNVVLHFISSPVFKGWENVGECEEIPGSFPNGLQHQAASCLLPPPAKCGDKAQRTQPCTAPPGCSGKNVADPCTTEDGVVGSCETASGLQCVIPEASCNGNTFTRCHLTGGGIGFCASVLGACGA
eukprot:TRINITY_DN15441_c0_g1_i1.p1 TRINITY_DN15441_c0_g1~~TRINITY_DN15441_c0_g1_i1.p1  ORF type:complete len:268 (+),score=30.51 TRINITY_DN15441_c0_g1_i1:28-831(+)